MWSSFQETRVDLPLKWMGDGQKVTSLLHIPILHPTVKLLETTFGFGESRTLDIAYISRADGKCYAWNNDNYSNFDDRYVTPQHLLTEKSYNVRIRLRGEFVDEGFSFDLRCYP